MKIKDLTNLRNPKINLLKYISENLRMLYWIHFYFWFIVFSIVLSMALSKFIRVGYSIPFLWWEITKSNGALSILLLVSFWLIIFFLFSFYYLAINISEILKIIRNKIRNDSTMYGIYIGMIIIPILTYSSKIWASLYQIFFDLNLIEKLLPVINTNIIEFLTYLILSIIMMFIIINNRNKGVMTNL